MDTVFCPHKNLGCNYKNSFEDLFKHLTDECEFGIN